MSGNHAAEPFDPNRDPNGNMTVCTGWTQQACILLPPDTKAEKITGNRHFDVPANVCNQQVGGSNPSTSSNTS